MACTCVIGRSLAEDRTFDGLGSPELFLLRARRKPQPRLQSYSVIDAQQDASGSLGLSHLGRQFASSTCPTKYWETRFFAFMR